MVVPHMSNLHFIILPTSSFVKPIGRLINQRPMLQSFFISFAKNECPHSSFINTHDSPFTFAYVHQVFALSLCSLAKLQLVLQPSLTSSKLTFSHVSVMPRTAGPYILLHLKSLSSSTTCHPSSYPPRSRFFISEQSYP